VSEAPHATFACSGNICRSPTAEKMFAHQIHRRGLGEQVEVSSAGTGGRHAGAGADRRAKGALRAHRYPTEQVFTVIAASLPWRHNRVDEQLGADGP
jgi:protein-tyrosine phosphatase